MQRTRKGWRAGNIARQISRKQMILRWTAIAHDAQFFDLRRAGSISGLAGMRQGIGLGVAPFAVAAASREHLDATHDR